MTEEELESVKQNIRDGKPVLITDPRVAMALRIIDTTEVIAK